MLSEELIELVEEIKRQRCERQDIELKSAVKGAPERIYDTLSAFANQTGGGIIIFGINEKDDYRVVGVYNPQDLQVRVTNAALQMEPAIRPVFTVAEYNGKVIVGAEIPECDTNDKPCYYKGAGKRRGSYIRCGEADLPMTEYEVYNYEVYKKKIRDELRPVEKASARDFDGPELQNYLLKTRRVKKQLEAVDEERLLELQGIMTDGYPTVTGINLLCKYPQGFFPQLGIIAMVVDGTEMGVVGSNGERFIDNRRIEGNIPYMSEEALSFVRRNMKNATIVDADGHRRDKTEYPVVAVREVILNALVHRDYSRFSEDSPVRIVMYKDRIEVENPGGLYGRLTVPDLGKLPGDTRNPFLAGNLETLIGTENRFSGIPTIYKEMERYGLKPPVFESKRGNFKVTLFNQSGDSCKEDLSGVYDMYVKDRYTGRSKQEITKQRIVEFCKTPKSKEEIAELLGISTTYFVVKAYLRPLIEEGKLMLTIPDKPQSKNQRYIQNRQGRSLIKS